MLRDAEAVEAQRDNDYTSERELRLAGYVRALLAALDARDAEIDRLQKLLDTVPCIGHDARPTVRKRDARTWLQRMIQHLKR